jgi:photosystem II stability/assembly factor-like uncharacterized protein
MKTFQYIVLFNFFLFSLSSQAQYNWEEIVIPDTVGVKEIAFDSTGYQFIASDKGVYYSENGYDWVQTSLLDYEGCIYVNKNNTIYAGEAYLYRSFDNAITWESLFYSSEGGIMSICTKGDSIIFVGTWGGIYRSIDSGLTWSHVLDSYNSEVFNDIIYNHEGILFSGSISYDGTLSPGGIYRSDNNGETWVLSGLDYHFVTSIVISEEDEIYVGTRGHGYYGGGRVFKSIDNGLTWMLKYENNLIESMSINIYGDVAIGCDSQEGEPGGILISYDGGESWEDITNNLPARAIDQVIYNPDNYLYAVTHFGGNVFKTDTPVGISIKSKLDRPKFFRVFPNPAHDKINILINEAKNCRITFFDILGNLIIDLKDIKNDDLINFNIENLSLGVYFIHFSCDSQTVFTYKFIKY